MHNGIRAIRPAAELRFNDCFHNADWGFILETMKPHLRIPFACATTRTQQGDPAG